MNVLGADDVPPPKPSRTPIPSSDQLVAPVSTYIVAQSPEVLAQLLKDNQTRGVCPSVYTTPASPFNTLAVQFQDEDKLLTTAIVADLPFAEPIDASLTTDPPSVNDIGALPETNLDSLESSLSSLNVCDQTPSRKVPIKSEASPNLYAMSAKTGSPSPAPSKAPEPKFEIYGPVANFTQSSAIVSSLSQSPTPSSLTCLDNSGPSSLTVSFEQQVPPPTETLYGPVMKFRPEAPSAVQCARAVHVNSPSPARAIYPQQIYSNLATDGAGVGAPVYTAHANVQAAWLQQPSFAQPVGAAVKSDQLASSTDGTLSSSLVSSAISDSTTLSTSSIADDTHPDQVCDFQFHQRAAPRVFFVAGSPTQGSRIEPRC